MGFRLLSTAACLIACCFASAQVLTLDNGVVGDGHLFVNTDAMGSYGNFEFATRDGYDPPGALTENSPGFAHGMFAFCYLGGGADTRNILSQMGAYNTTYAAGSRGGAPVLTTTVTSANTAMGAGKCASEFTLDETGGTLHLKFNVTQQVGAGPGGSAWLVQIYKITNTGTRAVDLKLNQHNDGDLIWDNLFDNDHVGAGGSGGWVYQREPADPAGSMTLSSGMPQTWYYGSKNGHLPTGGAPAMGFGTDIQMWDNYGTPTTWRNYIPDAGYNMDGQSLATTVGDAHISLEWDYHLNPGDMVSVCVTTTYGRTSPVSETLAPVAARVTRGTLGAGGLAQLLTRDDMRMEVVQRVQFAPTFAQAEIQCDFNATLARVTRMDFTFEGNTSGIPIGVMRQRIRVLDPSNNQFVQLEEIVPTNTDSERRVVVCDAERYVNRSMGNKITFDIGQRDFGALLAGWRLRADFVSLKCQT